MGWASVLRLSSGCLPARNPNQGFLLASSGTDVSFPRLRPSSLIRAIAQVIVSFAGFALPTTLSVLLPLLPTRTSQAYVVLTLLIPVLTYLLLSWVWLIARILPRDRRQPGGGHPVSAKS